MTGILIALIGIQFCLFIIVVISFYIKWQWVLSSIAEIIEILHLVDKSSIEFRKIQVSHLKRIIEMSEAINKCTKSPKPSVEQP